MITYVFPGQGSQQKGMGKELFGKYRHITDQANQILGYDLEALCLNDDKELLSQTQYTQPALFTVNTLTYLNKLDESGSKPDYVAGHSLGEYNALFAAGVFDFETGLKIVRQRGELMSRESGGGMAAIVGLTQEKIDTILNENNLHTVLSIANYNTPSQFVIAGPKQEIDQAQPLFIKSGARMYVPLKVSGAFHTRYMSAAKDQLRAFIEEIPFSSPSVPVISNLKARPYQDSELKTNLIDQIDHSVKWTESICYLMQRGEMAFEEIGPGKVLTGLIKKIIKEAGPFS